MAFISIAFNAVILLTTLPLLDAFQCIDDASSGIRKLPNMYADIANTILFEKMLFNAWQFEDVTCVGDCTVNVVTSIEPTTNGSHKPTYTPLSCLQVVDTLLVWQGKWELVPIFGQYVAKGKPENRALDLWASYEALMTFEFAAVCEKVQKPARLEATEGKRKKSERFVMSCKPPKEFVNSPTYQFIDNKFWNVPFRVTLEKVTTHGKDEIDRDMLQSQAENLFKNLQKQIANVMKNKRVRDAFLDAVPKTRSLVGPESRIVNREDTLSSVPKYVAPPPKPAPSMLQSFFAKNHSPSTPRRS